METSNEKQTRLIYDVESKESTMLKQDKPMLITMVLLSTLVVSYVNAEGACSVKVDKANQAKYDIKVHCCPR